MLFAPKGGTILLLVPTRFSERMCRESAWCGQNRPDETACFDPGGAQTAFGTQNSKCDRALTAPPEFKSLMLRQKTLRKRLLPEFSFIPIPSVYRSQDGTMSKYLYEDADLMVEWDFEKNSKLGLSPEKLTFGSNKNAWWKCKRGHAWQAVICKRTNGNQCPFCANKRVLVGYNDLPTLFPDLAREWDKEKNKKVELLSVVPGKNDLATVRPDLAQEWHPSKNGNLTPDMVTAGSDLRVWWRCRSCGHEWQTSVSHRVSGTGCSRCYRERNRENHPLSKRIYQYSLDGTFIREWKSISEAGRALHISASNITMCAQKTRKQAGGFCWKYDPPTEKNRTF